MNYRVFLPHQSPMRARQRVIYNTAGTLQPEFATSPNKV